MSSPQQKRAAAILGALGGAKRKHHKNKSALARKAAFARWRKKRKVRVITTYTLKATRLESPLIVPID